VGIGLRRLGRRLRVLGLRAGVVRYEPSVWSDERWRTAYDSGSLDYFASIEELGRYSILVGYLGVVGRGASILDVGCGPGILRGRVPDEWVGSYVGVDPTAGAIETASAMDAPRTRFVTGELRDVLADGPDDVVFCNEVLSVVPDPAALADDLVRAVRPGGHLLTSIWRHPGDQVLWRLLDARFQRVDEVVVRNPANMKGRDGWRVTMHRAS
jgi:2-polyprenyl-6-hydroxyphenyl methylase/3-demethylubiquinone-9 3-methyltransferase